MRIPIRLICAAALTFATVAGAIDGAALTDAQRELIQRGSSSGGWQSVLVGQVLGPVVNIEAFGHLEGKDGPAPDVNSRFQLDVVSSVYTGILLADLASLGRLRLSDPISKYLPTGFVCADARVCAITLEQLATHTSGLPAMPANLFSRDAIDPLRDYGEVELLQLLANYSPSPTAPRVRESVLGIGLLGWILGRVHGGGYAAALKEHVTTPLGLTSTSNDDGGLVPGRAYGEGVGATHASVLDGASGLRSSGDDQLRLVRAMLKPDESPLRMALMLSRQARGDGSRWGLGWRVDTISVDGQDWPLVWQQGNAGGHASFIGFRTDRQQAVVLLGNSSASLTPLGQTLLGDRPSPPAPAAAFVPQIPIGEYAGLYEFSAGHELLLRARGDTLTAQSGGRLAVRLRALEPDLFSYPDVPVQLAFQRDISGRITSLRWSENGVILPLRRLSERAPQLQRSALEGAGKSDVCGDYAVDAEVLARVSCRDGGFAFALSGAGSRPLVAYAVDRFASSDNEMELRVRRDAHGGVVALVLNLFGQEIDLPRVEWKAVPASVIANLHVAAVIPAAELAGPPAPDPRPVSDSIRPARSTGAATSRAVVTPKTATVEPLPPPVPWRKPRPPAVTETDKIE